jgi:cytochrome c-type biogenesis protein
LDHLSREVVLSFNLIGLFGAGLLTFASPCVLPLIPVYLALLLGGTVAAADGNRLRVRLSLLVNTLAFVLGMNLVFIALGLTATWLGGLLNAHRPSLVMAGGLVIFLFGLKFLGVLKVAWLEGERRLNDSKLQSRFHWLNALLMGLVFSLGWTPCIGPVLGSVLTYTASNTADPLTGALYLSVYGAGLSLPLLLIASLGDATRGLLARVRPWMPQLEKATGVFLALVGLYLLFSVNQPPVASMDVVQVSQAGTIIEPPLGRPSDRPRMVEFISSGCSICRQMIPTVAMIERDCGGKKVEVIKVDVDRQGNQHLARDFQIRGVPTFVYLDQTGAIAARLVGYQTLAALRQSLSALVGESCEGLGDFVYQKNSTCTPTTGVPCEK